MKILILMSTYNGEDYVKQQLLSIINQKTENDIYIRIRDDGSYDHTCEIIQHMMNEYPEKIELIKGDNRGYNASFFELLHNAQGYDYYALSDQDDVWLPEKIDAAIKALSTEDDSLALLYASPSFLVRDDLIPYGITRKKVREFTIYNTIIQNICPGHTQVINNTLLNKLKDKIDVKKIYVYDSWITNIAMLYGKIVYDINAYTFYRQHEKNQLGSGKGALGQLASSFRKLKSGDGIKYQQQIDYFIEKNEDKLKQEGFYTELFRYINSNSFIERLKYALSGKLYRQKKIETIAFYLAFVLGRY